MVSILSESISSEICLRIADKSKLYFVNRCMGLTNISASLNLKQSKITNKIFPMARSHALLRNYQVAQLYNNQYFACRIKV